MLTITSVAAGSTCTLEPRENVDRVAAFLARQPAGAWRVHPPAATLLRTLHTEDGRWQLIFKYV